MLFAINISKALALKYTLQYIFLAVFQDGSGNHYFYLTSQSVSDSMFTSITSYILEAGPYKDLTKITVLYGRKIENLFMLIFRY